jgi:hypothetical protein
MGLISHRDEHWWRGEHFWSTVGLLALGVLGLVGLGYLAWVKLFGVSAPPILKAAAVSVCNGTQPPGQPPNPPWSPPLLGWGGLVVVLNLLAFCLGSLWASVRQRVHGRVSADAMPRVTRHWAYMAAAVLLLAFAAFALGYEAWAVAPTQTKYWPITYYVRCADDSAPLQTLAGSLIISVLLGHWLAYRPKLEPIA